LFDATFDIRNHLEFREYYENNLWQTYGEVVSLLAQNKNIFSGIKRGLG
jgi:hypothetical protein